MHIVFRPGDTYASIVHNDDADDVDDFETICTIGQEKLELVKKEAVTQSVNDQVVIERWHAVPCGDVVYACPVFLTKDEDHPCRVKTEDYGLMVIRHRTLDGSLRHIYAGPNGIDDHTLENLRQRLFAGGTPGGFTAEQHNRAKVIVREIKEKAQRRREQVRAFRDEEIEQEMNAR